MTKKGKCEQKAVVKETLSSFFESLNQCIAGIFALNGRKTKNLVDIQISKKMLSLIDFYGMAATHRMKLAIFSLMIPSNK